MDYGGCSLLSRDMLLSSWSNAFSSRLAILLMVMRYRGTCWYLPSTVESLVYILLLYPILELEVGVVRYIDAWFIELEVKCF
jgi:hypothetical protein